MIERAIAILQEAGFKFTARELADIFWLAVHMEPSREQSPQHPTNISTLTQLPTPKPDSPKPKDTSTSEVTKPPDTLNEEPTAPLVLPSSTPKPNTTENIEAIPIKIPAAEALRNSLALGRALRPLKRKVPSSTEKILDEEATVQRFAKDLIGIPVLKSAPERWLELALVVEETSITDIWEQTIREFQLLLKHHGAFRDVRTWKLKVSESVTAASGQPKRIQLFAQNSTGFDELTAHKPDVLIDPKGRRLILLVSDCISPIWRKQLIHPVLELWGKRGLITILQLLPEKFWDRTALVNEIPVLLSTFAPGVYNSQLIAQLWDEDDIDEFSDEKNEQKSKTLNSLTSIPIITLEPEPLFRWSKVIAGQGNISTAGFKFYSFYSHQETNSTEKSSPHTPELSPSDLVNLFRANASLQARRLAGLMAAVPASISVVHLIQKTLLPESTQIHAAEVFMSGLLKRLPVSNPNDTGYIAYEFVDGVRELLRDFVPPNKQISVLDEVSNFIAKRFGLSPKEFEAQLLTYKDNNCLEAKIRPFARLKAQVLRQLGGKYAREAEELEKINQISKIRLFFQTYNFSVATITLIDDSIEPQTFKFEVAFIEINHLLEIVNEAVFNKIGQPLTDIEQQVLNGALENLTYKQIYNRIVESTNYSESEEHLRYRIGGQLWKVLTEIVGEKVNKSNAKAVINQWVTHPRLTIRRYSQQATGFIENLGKDTQLEMMLIPGGTFVMGSPPGELEHQDDESPQHPVTVQPFFFAKYPVTQAQWQFVAQLPQVNRSLDPDPSRFKGANRPVEQVTWLDAVEFCDRLSKHTKKLYRLPSEAEWEYACRAGTATPFHFGETITTDIANYNGDYTYGAGSKGIYREETTPVGSFGVANAFGLYDMHGNVWEWCADHWHDNYKDAPDDGSAWVEQNENKNDSQIRRVLRGGSWFTIPELCRSACRAWVGAGGSTDSYGFRVVCAAAWTQ